MSSEQLTIDTLKKLFEKSADVTLQQFTFGKETVHFIHCEAMVDEKLLNESVLPKVKTAIESLENSSRKNASENNGQNETKSENKNQNNQSNENESNQSNENQNNQSNENQNNQSNENQSNQRDENQNNQSNENQNNQSNENQSNQSNENQSKQSNENESNQRDESQNNQSNENQNNQSNENQSNQSNENQSKQSNENESNQRDESQSNQSDENQNNQNNENQNNQSDGNESNQSNENQSNQSNENQSNQSNENQSNQSNENQNNQSNENQSNQRNGNESKQSDENQSNQSNGNQNISNNESPSGSEGNKSRFEQISLLPGIQKITDKEQAITLMYRGSLLIYLEQEQTLYACNISDKPNRSPEETKLEVVLKGPRDDFIEDLAVNIALIRKRLPTNSLCVEKLEVGERSKTDVAILYFDDIVDKKILKEIKNQIQKVDVDIVYSTEALMDEVNKKMFFFPRIDYTGRPDYAIQSLATGRFIILVDGVSYAVITPITFFMLLKTGEDNDFPSISSSFARVLRLIGLLIGVFLPGFWLALTTFHQNQLPLQLLATIVQSKSGLPFPSALEMVLMLLFFEIFREAGLRLPTVLGSTIGVVGGLIIGDAAIRAGITSPATVVVIALSTTAAFTLVNLSLVSTISVLRLIFLFVSSVLGLFGFFISLFFLLLIMANIKVFGVPYLNIGADLNWNAIKKTFLRVRQENYKKRPSVLKTQDETRNKKAKQ